MTQKQTTLYIIAYDIPSDKRRTKIHKILSGFGHWTQYSLFECYLDEKEYLQLRQRLDRVICEEEDTVRLYPLCLGCRNKVETIGSAKPKEPDIFLV